MSYRPTPPGYVSLWREIFRIGSWMIKETSDGLTVVQHNYHGIVVKNKCTKCKKEIPKDVLSTYKMLYLEEP
jgi:hypothetical protein